MSPTPSSLPSKYFSMSRQYTTADLHHWSEVSVLSIGAPRRRGGGTTWTSGYRPVRCAGTSSVLRDRREAPGRSSAGRRLQPGDVELDLLHHLPHDRLGMGPGEQVVELLGHDLPGQPEPVRAPPALRLAPAVADDRLPQ